MYTYIKANDNHYAVNAQTGEITGTTWVEVPYGTVFWTPEDQEKWRKRQEAELQKQIARTNNKSLGTFICLSRDISFDRLPPAVAVRLIVLATYSNYFGILMRTERTPIQRKDIPHILGISESAVSCMWNHISPAFIAESEDGKFHLVDNGAIWRGSRGKRGHIPFMKAYISTIRKLYATTNRSNHGHLGYIFQLLPYINREWNILCHNPSETDLDLIQPLTLTELCNCIEYNSSNLHRLLKAFHKISFDVDDHQERFVSIVSDGLRQSAAKVFVNPRILYTGSDYKKVAVLGAFCR